ncbi:MAG: trimethylamine methyltransferase family protein [Deltaproteobacteria bacterium]|jgi:trimethylamine--corrinoid protein Co-methyltransferase|nr:trimethylamine methyltransferase family protein [Deltaproteobacteria bacterium]
MSDCLRHFSTADLNAVHSASMELLECHGVVIKSEAVADFFQSRGFSVDGYKIKITEHQVRHALETSPKRFSLRARNPKNDLDVGGSDPVLSGTGGPPLIIEANGLGREARLEDYRKFCKLIHTSRLPQAVPHEMIHPMDLPANTAHLDMLFLDTIMCDRVLTGDTQDLVTTRDTIKVLGLIFGGLESLESSAPVSINIINPLSPLGFAPDQAEALMLLADHNQAVAITNMILLGSTAPVDLASALALGNAELLAGVVLSQLARPGAPVIYGSTSCQMEMRSGLTCLGRPETLFFIMATTALARFYQLPSRAGGALTDAHMVDAQAGFESALMLNAAIEYGVDYILHAFGMMASYMGASLEKWVIDEEVASMLLAARQGERFKPEEIDVDYMAKIGAGGNYLSSPRTFKSFRSLYQGGFLSVQSKAAWKAAGSMSAAEKAAKEVERRIGSYQAPAIDLGLRQELETWIAARKRELA